MRNITARTAGLRSLGWNTVGYFRTGGKDPLARFVVLTSPFVFSSVLSCFYGQILVIPSISRFFAGKRPPIAYASSSLRRSAAPVAFRVHARPFLFLAVRKSPILDISQGSDNLCLPLPWQSRRPLGYKKSFFVTALFSHNTPRSNFLEERQAMRDIGPVI